MRDLPIIMYHNVEPAHLHHPLSFLRFTPKQFEAHLRYFRNRGYETLHFSELDALAESGALYGGRFLILTFDDGYLDNLLIARDLLSRYRMKATIFVNPEFMNDGAARVTPDHLPGYLNYAEAKRLAEDGVCEIQSHTMSHDHVFVSSRLIDVYCPDKFDQYYWLSWLLFPDCKPRWLQMRDELRIRIPSGFPIFEHGRALAGPKFLFDIAQAMHLSRRLCGESDSLIGDVVPNVGRMETAAEYAARVLYELGESKEPLERRIGKPINALCFPGGAYCDDHLTLAKSLGYLYYMANSRDTRGNNLQSLKMEQSGSRPIRLRRTCISNSFGASFPGPCLEKINLHLKMRASQGQRSADALLRSLRRCHSLISHRKSHKPA
jgi:peptidoglycan/xylan/chitin deacetylase (PgdA/CDA1 family)